MLRTRVETVQGSFGSTDCTHTRAVYDGLLHDVAGLLPNC